MNNISCAEMIDKSVWENYLLSTNPHSFLQSWNWGEVNRFLGHKIFRLGFYNENKLIGVVLIIKEEAKRGPHFIIPSGPIIDWNDRNLVSSFMKEINRRAKEEKVWFVRMRPELTDTIDNNRIISNLGFIDAPMHLHGEHTMIVDITPNEEEILSRMRKNTRYAIRKSLKEGFDIEISSNKESANTLFELQTETVERHKFIGFKKSLFINQLKLFSDDNSGAIFVCSKEGKPLVAAMVIYYGDYAYYHHSGSSDEARYNNASYFTQWNIILEAKKHGCKYYDLWGIAKEDNPKHRFYGITVFKKGFGGERFNWVHAKDLVISPLYWATFIFETGRRIARRL